MAPQVPARWLVVDDGPAVRERFRRPSANARLGGVEVASAANGPEALEWLRREKLDVALSDCRPGGTDGIQAGIASHRSHARELEKAPETGTVAAGAPS